jgi:hypothetical protein
VAKISVRISVRCHGYLLNSDADHNDCYPKHDVDHHASVIAKPSSDATTTTAPVFVDHGRNALRLPSVRRCIPHHRLFHWMIVIDLYCEFNRILKPHLKCSRLIGTDLSLCPLCEVRYVMMMF